MLLRQFACRFCLQPLQSCHSILAATSTSPTTTATNQQQSSSPFSTNQLSLTAKESDAVNCLYSRLTNGQRAGLAESITLVESHHPRKRVMGNILLEKLLRDAENRRKTLGKEFLPFRIGISGSPGVGKSSFIEEMGFRLLEKGHKIAVLTVDPSSQTTGGSLLGDLTRMTRLSVADNAYIRSSPSHGTLGGVTRGTQEAITLCEAAGYDVILVETVGVGQSEIAVADMVDLFCLLISPTHGDELQGVKRGVMEVSDLILVTKSDGELVSKARNAQAEYISALKFFRPRSPNWRTVVMRVSAHKGDGMNEMWDAMQEFRLKMLNSGELEGKRLHQLTVWIRRHIEHELMSRVQRHGEDSGLWKNMEKAVQAGLKTPGSASEEILNDFMSSCLREQLKTKSSIQG